MKNILIKSDKDKYIVRTDIMPFKKKKKKRQKIKIYIFLQQRELQKKS